MRILAISDEECPFLWDYYVPGRLDEYDLILSCGDLKASYLSFLVTMAKCPVLYVPGNHDGGYEENPPEGCDNIDCQIVEYRGVRILGIGGCKKYRMGPNQYTEGQMRRRLFHLRRKLRRMGGVDIVVTHASPEGFGDGEDRAHWGFAAYRDLMEAFSPKFWFHGHTHMNYGGNTHRELRHGQTRIINAYERFTVELPDRPYPPEQKYEVVRRTRLPREQNRNRTIMHL